MIRLIGILAVRLLIGILIIGFPGSFGVLLSYILLRILILILKVGYQIAEPEKLRLPLLYTIQALRNIYEHGYHTGIIVLYKPVYPVKQLGIEASRMLYDKVLAPDLSYDLIGKTSFIELFRRGLEGSVLDAVFPVYVLELILCDLKA